MSRTAPAGVGNPALVQARVFDIEYQINEEALPLTAVQLWYTADEGRTWQLYGDDSDGQSPASFHAPAEGLFGFYFVLVNAVGASSAAPGAETTPHAWAFVDYTPPIIQLHPLRQTTVLGQRAIEVRWTAVDAHLRTRPIEVMYSLPPDETWHRVTDNPMANTGRFDWRLPEERVGPVAIRLAVRDKGGHITRSETRTIEVAAAPVVSQTAKSADAARLTGTVTAEARERAQQIFREGLAYRDRGEYRLGIARMREAVRLDPALTAAFAESGRMLYRIGDVDRALGAYEIALKQDPAHRDALHGLAAVQRKKGDYAAAAAGLREILRLHPNDAEVWMNLGDVAVFQGDEILARRAYAKAVEVDPEATEVIADAGKRLALMAEVSRDYTGLPAPAADMKTNISEPKDRRAEE